MVVRRAGRRRMAGVQRMRIRQAGLGCGLSCFQCRYSHTGYSMRGQTRHAAPESGQGFDDLSRAGLPALLHARELRPADGAVRLRAPNTAGDCSPGPWPCSARHLQTCRGRAGLVDQRVGDTQGFNLATGLFGRGDVAAVDGQRRHAVQGRAANPWAVGGAGAAPEVFTRRGVTSARRCGRQHPSTEGGRPAGANPGECRI
ncbi:MAG: hypothetical protein RLZZ584_3136 [Pseudomonadota bacterium]